MRENPYPVLGTRSVTMRGRTELFGRLCRHLTKQTPDHVSLVGPRHIGKTVILKHLAEHFSRKNEHYITALYWDLRHGTPDSDTSFKKRFAEEVQKALAHVHKVLASELAGNDEDVGGLIEAVFDLLKEDGKRVLCVLDGFDRVLAGVAITRNLWDYMRDLAHRSSLRLVTGSRRRLQELCKTQESRTSDFWEIFYDTPIQVGPFEEKDWEKLLDPFSAQGITFDSSARKELVNWTGGVPVLTAALLARLHEWTTDGTELSKAQIDEIAALVAEECQDHLGGLWNDCTADTKADLASLSSGPIPLTELPKERQRSLKEKGYGVIVGNQMRSACRIITRYAESQSAEVQNMRRLFGDSQRFDENIQNLLELRLNQVSRFNVQLLNYLQNAIRDLYPDPAGAIAWMRQIADHALDLIWEKELPRSKTIPAATLSEWKYAGVTFRDMEKGILPSSRGTQCYVLRLMVGTKQGDKQIQRVARYVRKPTYLLVDYIQSVGDFGQHLQGNRVPLRFAASVCLAAIELVESLAADFGTN